MNWHHFSAPTPLIKLTLSPAGLLQTREDVAALIQELSSDRSAAEPAVAAVERWVLVIRGVVNRNISEWVGLRSEEDWLAEGGLVGMNRQLR